MQKIASFQVNHDTLKPGMYISRVDGDVVTYDIRMKTPNAGDYLDNAAMHTIEHLFATYARNTKFAGDVVYVGPMGCRTGFYLLMRDRASHEDALNLVRDSFRFIADFEGDIPGAEFSYECGNYKEHDLSLAKREAASLTCVLDGYTVDAMTY